MKKLMDCFDNVVPATKSEIDNFQQIANSFDDAIPDKFQLSNGEMISFSEIESFNFHEEQFALVLTFKYSEKTLKIFEDEASDCYGWLLGNCFCNYGFPLASGTFIHH